MTKYIFEMDKENEECLCLDESGNRCNFISKRCMGDLENRPAWCPLVEEKDSMYPREVIAEKIQELYDIIEQNHNYAGKHHFDVDKSLKIALEDNGWEK